MNALAIELKATQNHNFFSVMYPVHTEPFAKFFYQPVHGQMLGTMLKKVDFHFLLNNQNNCSKEPFEVEKHVN